MNLLNQPLPVVPTPSLVKSMDARELTGTYAKGTAVINKTILNALLMCYIATEDAEQEKMLHNCAAAMVALVSNHIADAYGPFSALSLPDENTIGGLFGAQLQHLLSTKLFPENRYSFIPSVLACVQQKLPAGSIDLAIYKNVEGGGLHPRALFEFSVASPSKFTQLFTYASNASTVLTDDLHLVLIGATVTMRPDKAAQIELYAFVKILGPDDRSNPSGATANVASIGLYKDTWSIESVHRVLRVIRYMVSLEMESFLLPAGGLPPYGDLDRNIIQMDERNAEGIDVSVVYKIYDYQHAPSVRKRSSEGNCKFIPGCVEIINHRGLCLIKYPKVEGDHTPTSSKAFTGILQHLHEVQSQQYVHMDIRLFNCVFNNTDGSQSRLIDFDFSGPASVQKYPPGYNVNIEDGARHRNAIAGNAGQSKHDWWSLSAVMDLFHPAEVAHTELWQDWAIMVRDGELLSVAQEINRQPAIILQFRKPLMVSATGAKRPRGDSLQQHE